MKRTTILGICLTALVAFAVWAPNVFAYGSSSSCLGCHSGFGGTGASLHDAHNDYINECLACHQSVGDTPDINSSGNTLGFGCVGCHEPDGLQEHHINAEAPPDGSGLTCANCHPTRSPLPESNAPPYYGTPTTLLVDPCVSSPSPPGEDADGDGFGLDNDGDLAYDEDDPDCAQPVKNDFNGDGYSDVLLRNTGGSWITYLMDADGVSVLQVGYPPLTSSLGWQFAGIGDFNGDGYSDVLLRNTGGSWITYLMDADGVSVLQVGYPPLTSSLGWQFAGIGDFNGDGYSDVLLRNTGGSWITYLMDADGVSVLQVGYSPLTSSLGWQFAGIGDFNGDGYSDVLLRNTGGSWITYLMDADGVSVLQVGYPPLTSSLGWQFAGIGDFNGDGYSDVLLRDTGGSWITYLMDADGVSVLQVGYPPLTSSLGWQFAGIGDFNGDGYSDVLLRNTGGSWITYLMDADGVSVLQVGYPPLTSSLGWQYQ